MYLLRSCVYLFLKYCVLQMFVCAIHNGEEVHVFKPTECRKCHQLIENPAEIEMFRGFPCHSGCVGARRYAEDQAKKWAQTL